MNVLTHPHIQAHLSMDYFKEEKVAWRDEATKCIIWHEPDDTKKLPKAG